MEDVIGLVLALTAFSVAAHAAAQPAPPAPIVTTRTSPIVETLGGAAVRIDMPAAWNGGLVIYCHGYTPVPATYDHSPASQKTALFLERGFAVAQSGYSAGGWAIAEAVEDVERLRVYFTRRFGAPKETCIVGESLGGFLTLVLMAIRHGH